MKNIVSLIFILSVLISGCGEDRSQFKDENLSGFGDKNISWIYEKSRGQQMVSNNFVYIPGGFDVDGDGLDEGGFWLSIYEAKEDTNGTFLNIGTNNIKTFLADNFQVYNKENGLFDKTLSLQNSFLEVPSSSIEGFKVAKVKFDKDGNIIAGVSPLEAVVSLQSSQINGGETIKLPTEKQWMHVVMLVVNNPKNWTSGEVGKGKLFQGDKYTAPDRNTFYIANNILGEDVLVPQNYEVNVSDLSGGVSEWTSGMITVDDRFLTGDSGKNEYSEINKAPFWWKPVIKGESVFLGSIQGAGQYHDGFAKAGANDTLKISLEGTGDVNTYAIVARGGSNSIDDEILIGVSAAKLSYGPGHKGPTIGFRAASAYLY